MPPWDAIISGAVGLLGSGLNFGSARKNREMQIQLNRENNQFNAEQAQIQRDWTEQMYNQYQSPQALAQQYEDAGFNKYLAMKGGAGSIASGSSASASGVPSLQAPQFDVSGIGQIMAGVANAIRISKEASWIDQNQIENLNYLRAQGAKLEGDTNWFNLSGKGLRFDQKSVGDWITAQREGELRRLDLSNKLLAQQSVLYDLDATAKRLSNYYYPKQVQADLALKFSQMADLASQIDFRKLQSATEKRKAAQILAEIGKIYATTQNVMEDTQGKRIDNSTKRQLQSSYIQAARTGYNWESRRNVYGYEFEPELQRLYRDAKRLGYEKQVKDLDWYFLNLLFGGAGTAALKGAISPVRSSSGRSD